MQKIEKKTPGMYFKKLILFFCFLTISLENIFSQSETIGNLSQAFDRFQQTHLQEKIFVHTDKLFYLSGEIIWFKLYTVDAGFFHMSDLSKVAYVEIINKDQKPLLQAKIFLRNGLGNGSLYLPLSVPSGNYKLRAYTSWMKNYGIDCFFEKNITIVNTIKKLEPRQEPDSSGYDIQFFPEGGNLVNHLESKIAFRMVDHMGKGVDFEGVLVNQHMDTVASFHPQKFGIGNFLFTPDSQDQYSAIMRLPDSSIITAYLPKIQDDGYVLRISDTSNNRLAVHVRSAGYPANTIDFLFIHGRQNIKFARMQMETHNETVFFVDKDSLDEGISRFTLFNYNRQPLCERLYFKRPRQALFIDLKSDRQDYGKRKKIILEIGTTDQSGKSCDANMSLAVYKLDSLSPADGNNIFSYLWLSSDLKGHVESPAYYMQTESAELNQATDNLMLSHGWSRYSWEDVLKNNSPAFEFAPEMEGHLIAGKVVDKNSGLPVKNIPVYLSSPGKRFQLGNAESNKEGLVWFDMKDFFGTDGIVVQTQNQKDSNYRIDILSPFSEKYPAEKLPEYAPAEGTEKALLSHSIATQVQNTYSASEIQKFRSPEYRDSTVFYGKPDQRYYLDDYTRFNTMEEVMREYIANVELRKRDGRFRLKILNYPYRLFFDKDPLVLFDGVPVTDIDKIIAFDPLKVKRIDVMNREYFLGPLVAEGIVSYSTYKGDLAGYQLDPNVIVLKYDGLQPEREFYAPVYDSQDQLDSRLPDFRNLLFWSPDINTSGSGKKQLSFFTSDVKGRFIAVLQGITTSGSPAIQTIGFNVIP
jgi:hypothetical protein